MSDTPKTTVSMILEIPAVWQRPYPDLDVYRLYVGPFYAGEISRGLEGNWKASMPSAGLTMEGYTEASAREMVEREIRRACAEAKNV